MGEYLQTKQIKVGEFVLITSGDYSQYGPCGLYRCIRDHELIPHEDLDKSTDFEEIPYWEFHTSAQEAERYT